MTELRDNVPFLLVNTHRSGIIPSSALSTLTISCYHQETILGLQKYKGVLFIELTHENFQLHHLHISFLKKKSDQIRWTCQTLHLSHSLSLELNLTFVFQASHFLIFTHSSSYHSCSIFSDILSRCWFSGTHSFTSTSSFPILNLTLLQSAGLFLSPFWTLSMLGR